MRAPGTGGRSLVPWFLRHLRLVPLILLVVGLLIDFYTPARFSLEALYVAAPMTAAALLSLRVTILSGLGACAADAAMLTHFGYLGGSSGYSELAAVATVSAIAVVVNRLMHYRDVRLQSAREITLAVQRAVLPQPPASVGSLRIAVRYQAAVREAQIGGDLYAVQDTPYGMRCLVGDVRGKGMETIKAVDIVLGVFREAAEDEPTLTRIAARLERGLLREAAGPARAEDFVTAVLAEIPPSGEELRLVNRGHPAPLLHERQGRVRSLEPSEPALPLCLGGLAPREDAADTVPLPPEATLLLYTDGLTEARDRTGAFFDPVAALTGREFSGPDELLDTLLADVDRHTGGRITDDTALLAITRGATRGTPGSG